MSAAATPTRSEAYKAITTTATVLTVAGMIALIVGIVMVSNPPNYYMSDAIDQLKHSAAVSSAFSLAGGLIGLAIVVWMIAAAVNAVLAELSTRVKRLSVSAARPGEPAAAVKPVDETGGKSTLDA